MSRAEEFINEPFVDFSVAENAAGMEAAIEKVRSELGSSYPLIINGEKIFTEKNFGSVNPCESSQVVGLCSDADVDSRKFVRDAIDAASEAFEVWRKVPVSERVEYLFKAADIIRERKHYYSAWMCFETGKNWAEADGDTAEAIDFLEYYGREMLRWSEEQPIVPSPFAERNSFEYIPLGVGAIIPPWNFPLAIMAGMTMAAVVSGNTTVLKPSPDAPIIAYKFMEILDEIGLPKGVVNFIPGSGTEVGELMVKDSKVRFISFTGSKVVGLKIYEESAKTQPGQKWMKRVVAEMGGKDAIVVAADADLDSAASGIVSSAFGFQGQKCSACSRVIADESIYEDLLKRVVEKASQIKVGKATDAGSAMTAVINKKAFDRALSMIEKGIEDGGSLVLGGGGDASDGYFVQPTIIRDVKPGDTIEQTEIFAPVLAFVKAKDFDHAIEIANGTEYGLTGSVYSADPKKLEIARRDFHVGNLYLNRKCTGALVGVHPFGGFNMSGTDSKAGGREYLLQFLQGKSIAQAK